MTRLELLMMKVASAKEALEILEADNPEMAATYEAAQKAVQNVLKDPATAARRLSRYKTALGRQGKELKGAKASLRRFKRYYTPGAAIGGATVGGLGTYLSTRKQKRR
jgi:hypothetical protein